MSHSHHRIDKGKPEPVLFFPRPVHPLSPFRPPQNPKFVQGEAVALRCGEENTDGVEIWDEFRILEKMKKGEWKRYQLLKHGDPYMDKNGKRWFADSDLMCLGIQHRVMRGEGTNCAPPKKKIDISASPPPPPYSPPPYSTRGIAPPEAYSLFEAPKVLPSSPSSWRPLSSRRLGGRWFFERCSDVGVKSKEEKCDDGGKLEERDSKGRVEERDMSARGTDWMRGRRARDKTRRRVHECGRHVV